MEPVNIFTNNDLWTRALSPQNSGLAESAIIRATMPSPIGHALAGLAVAWGSDLLPPRAGGRPGGLHPDYVCVMLAVLPDADLLLPVAHRTVTHSIAAVAAVGLLIIVASRVTGKVTRTVAVACVAAYASHLLLDWLQTDPT